jgi:2,3-bisphosphoglycerate-dependent phosphoglycerate mutase
MHKIIYVIRHCQATGQEPEAPLTTAGRAQAQALAGFLLDSKIERIVSSPFLRAIQSIEPLACSLGMEIETDERLVERILSSTPLPDWLTCLRDTFTNPDLSFPGGESSRMATQRAVSALEDILDHEQQITALISHGNLSTLLLGHFDTTIGFSTWERMTNPDVFRVCLSASKTTVEHLWKSVP